MSLEVCLSHPPPLSRTMPSDIPPLAINLVNSSVPYAYDARTRTYAQPTFAYQTLERIRTVNAEALKTMTTAQPTPIERHGIVPAGTLLTDLISYGTRDQSAAPTVLEAVLAELGAQTRSVRLRPLCNLRY